MARVCPCCDGSREEKLNFGHGNYDIFDCSCCDGTGVDPESCEECEANWEVWDEHGKLCQDCWMEAMIEDDLADLLDDGDEA
jgi:hypothetical protein